MRYIHINISIYIHAYICIYMYTYIYRGIYKYKYNVIGMDTMRYTKININTNVDIYLQ